MKHKTSWTHVGAYFKALQQKYREHPETKLGAAVARLDAERAALQREHDEERKAIRDEDRL